MVGCRASFDDGGVLVGAARCAGVFFGDGLGVGVLVVDGAGDVVDVVGGFDEAFADFVGEGEEVVAPAHGWCWVVWER